MYAHYKLENQSTSFFGFRKGNDAVKWLQLFEMLKNTGVKFEDKRVILTIRNSNIETEGKKREKVK